MGRTLLCWLTQITNWHRGRVSNGPTEAINNLIKRIKRILVRVPRFRNYRIRVLLYSGRPNWNLLPHHQPRSNPMSQFSDAVNALPSVGGD